MVDFVKEERILIMKGSEIGVGKGKVKNKGV